MHWNVVYEWIEQMSKIYSKVIKEMIRDWLRCKEVRVAMNDEYCSWEVEIKSSLCSMYVWNFHSQMLNS